jgi:hypothetical protein
MKKLLILLMLTAFTSCATTEPSDFYVGCMGGAIVRDQLTDTDFNMKKVQVFDHLCKEMDANHKLKKKEDRRRKFPDIREKKQLPKVFKRKPIYSI